MIKSVIISIAIVEYKLIEENQEEEKPNQKEESP